MSEKAEREAVLRLPMSIYDQWLRRCHREGIDPDTACVAVLRKALERDGSIIGDGEMKS